MLFILIPNLAAKMLVSPMHKSEKSQVIQKIPLQKFKLEEEKNASKKQQNAILLVLQY